MKNFCFLFFQFFFWWKLQFLWFRLKGKLKLKKQSSNLRGIYVFLRSESLFLGRGEGSLNSVEFSDIGFFYWALLRVGSLVIKWGIRKTAWLGSWTSPPYKILHKNAEIQKRLFSFLCFVKTGYLPTISIVAYHTFPQHNNKNSPFWNSPLFIINFMKVAIKMHMYPQK